MKAERCRAALAVDAPFDLRLTVFGHGFVDLPPNRWDEDRKRLTTVVEIGRRAVDLEIFSPETAARRRQRRAPGAAGLVLEATSARPLAVRDRASLRAAAIRMLRLDEDFSAFWARCAREPRLSWAARRGAGRLLRSPTLFEDLVKLLFTTNTIWAATRGMVQRLTRELGRVAPSGRASFPGAAVCAEQSERFYRDAIRVGYRARPMLELARGFAGGALSASDFEDPALSTDEVRRRLLALPGFGPYAAGQALRLLGRYSDLALDSWCRKRLGELSPRAKSDDAAIQRRYARYGDVQGLVLWLDCTAEWHGEGPRAKRG